jgi:hypothetical protein
LWPDSPPSIAGRAACVAWGCSVAPVIPRCAYGQSQATRASVRECWGCAARAGFGCASGSGFALVKLCAYAFSYRQSAPVVHQNSFALRSGAGLVTRTTVTGCVTTRSTTHSLAEQKTGGCCAWPGSPSHQPPDFYAVFRGTYPSSRVVSSCAIANECATLPHYFAVCKAYLHLFLSIVRPSLIRDINPSRLTASRLAILMGYCLKT